MPYPSPHLYLTVRWLDDREPDEMGQFGLRFSSIAETVTQGMVDGLASAVSTFWTTANIPGHYVLSSLRLALVGEDGHYVPGVFSRDYLYPGTGVRPSTGSVVFPMQVASVATLLTDRPSGLASRGRVYLPPISSALGTDGRWSVAQVDQRATAVATLLSNLNNAIDLPETSAQTIASVFSKGSLREPQGVRANITGVKVGTRPDVQRRRAKNMDERYGAVKAVTQ